MQRTFLMLVCTILLSGCQTDITYSYLMAHPREIRQAMDGCESSSSLSSERNAQCQVVFKAAADAQSLINDMLQDRQQFGQKILDAQMTCVTIKAQMKEAKQTLNQLKATNAEAQAIQSAEASFNAAQKRYQDQQVKIKSMIAIVGMLSSPE